MADSRRMRWLGGPEWVTIAVAIFALVGAPLAVRAQGRSQYAEQREAIAAEEARAPLTTLDWADADLGFAAADLPGEVRRVEVRPTYGGTTTAAFVGGYGRGAAVAEVHLEGSRTSSATLANQAHLIIAMGEELGEVSTGSYYLWGQRADPRVNHRLDAAAPNLIEGTYELREQDHNGVTTIRVRLVDRGDRQFLVMTLWPLGEPEEMIERIADSVRAS